MSASVRGTSHEADQTECQDHGRCEPIADNVLLSVASDGAGSAPHSAVGSELACQTLFHDLQAHIAGGQPLTALDQAFVAGWQQRFVRSVRERALALGLPDEPRLFACTVVGALVGEDAGFFFQIGDGAVVVARRDHHEGYEPIFWPDGGEMESTTYFVTDDDAAQHIHCRLLEDAPIDEVAVFTDGLQRLALSFSDRTAHRPFFAPLFAELRKHASGHSERLSGDLERFLGSSRINQRTDDDKTLILTTRVVADGARLVVG